MSCGAATTTAVSSQALSEGVFVQDRLGKMLTVNSAAAKILGMDLERLTGHEHRRTRVGHRRRARGRGGRQGPAGPTVHQTGKPTVGEVFGMRVAG